MALTSFLSKLLQRNSSTPIGKTVVTQQTQGDPYMPESLRSKLPETAQDVDVDDHNLDTIQ